MATNDIKSEEIVSAAIVSVPNLCDTSGWDITRDRITGGANRDCTDPDQRTAVKGHGKSSATNSPGNHGSQGGA